SAAFYLSINVYEFSRSYLFRPYKANVGGSTPSAPPIPSRIHWRANCSYVGIGRRVGRSYGCVAIGPRGLRYPVGERFNRLSAGMLRAELPVHKTGRCRAAQACDIPNLLKLMTLTY